MLLRVICKFLLGIPGKPILLFFPHYNFNFNIVQHVGLLPFRQSDLFMWSFLTKIPNSFVVPY